MSDGYRDDVGFSELSSSLGESLPVTPVLRWLGRVEYRQVWTQMQAFNQARDSDSRDEIWFLEHEPVFTLGMNASSEHVLMPGVIPVVQTDRGGQVTYHGPGQLVAYPLLDVRRLGLGVRQLVQALESAVIGLAASRNVQAYARREAPGVYVGNCKLASIGLRIKRGCSYHGLALNVAMDREPFRRINPCGFAGLEVTDLAALGVRIETRELAQTLAPFLLAALGLSADLEWAAPEQAFPPSSP